MSFVDLCQAPVIPIHLIQMEFDIFFSRKNTAKLVAKCRNNLSKNIGSNLEAYLFCPFEVSNSAGWLFSEFLAALPCSEFLPCSESPPCSEGLLCSGGPPSLTGLLSSAALLPLAAFTSVLSFPEASCSEPLLCSPGLLLLAAVLPLAASAGLFSSRAAFAHHRVLVLPRGHLRVTVAFALLGGPGIARLALGSQSLDIVLGGPAGVMLGQNENSTAMESASLAKISNQWSIKI